MVVIGMGLLFASYTIGMYGYCLIRGYSVSFTGMFGTTWPAAGKSGQGSQPILPGTNPSTGITVT